CPVCLLPPIIGKWKVIKGLPSDETIQYNLFYTFYIKNDKYYVSVLGVNRKVLSNGLVTAPNYVIDIDNELGIPIINGNSYTFSKDGYTIIIDVNGDNMIMPYEGGALLEL